MDISSVLADRSAEWCRENPASPAAIQKLVNESGVELPEEYLHLLCHSNGGEGELAVEPGWFQIWPAEQVVALNEGYEVARNMLQGCSGSAAVVVVRCLHSILGAQDHGR